MPINICQHWCRHHWHHCGQTCRQQLSGEQLYTSRTWQSNLTAESCLLLLGELQQIPSAR